MKLVFAPVGLSLTLLLGGCSEIIGLGSFHNQCGGDVDETCPPGSGGSGGTSQSTTSSGGPTTCKTVHDCPDSETACGSPVCDHGVCTTSDTKEGATCTDSGGSFCDGAGKCVECLKAADCKADSSCVIAACAASHACSTTNADEGATCSEGEGNVCDGHGKCVECNKEADCPTPATTCLTLSGCQSQKCETMPASAGTACTDAGGNVCNAAGQCFGVASINNFSTTCSITTLGGLYCWGGNWSDGDGTDNVNLTPVPATGLDSGVAQVVSGQSNTYVLTKSGGVKAWGAKGLLGNGSGGLGTAETAVDVNGLTGVQQLAAGVSHVCALLTAGSAKCWGSNTYGEIGNGMTSNSYVESPVAVASVTGALAITAGQNHTCVLTSGHGVKCWGHNNLGQLGNNQLTDSVSPVDVVSLSSGVAAISANGGDTTCALKQNGGVVCWGDNTYGQVGTNSSATSWGQPAPVIGLSAGVQAISVGGGHACALLQTGAVNCWGWNVSGQLGDGTTTNRKAPVLVSGLSGMVVGMTAGGGSTCAALKGGAAMCWGNNASGELGDGTQTNRSHPVAVFGL